MTWMPQVLLCLLCLPLRTCQLGRCTGTVFTQKRGSFWSQIQLNTKTGTQHLHRRWIRAPDFVTKALSLEPLVFWSKRGAAIHTEVIVGLHIGASVLWERGTKYEIFIVSCWTEYNCWVQSAPPRMIPEGHAVFAKLESPARSRSGSISYRSCQVVKTRFDWSIILRWQWRGGCFA